MAEEEKQNNELDERAAYWVNRLSAAFLYEGSNDHEDIITIAKLIVDFEQSNSTLKKLYGTASKTVEELEEQYTTDIEQTFYKKPSTIPIILGHDRDNVVGYYDKVTDEIHFTEPLPATIFMANKARFGISMTVLESEVVDGVKVITKGRLREFSIIPY